MPSPIAHLSVGYLLYRTFTRYRPSWNAKARSWKQIILLGAFLSLSMLPDLDSVGGVLANDLGRYHNQWTHSLFATIAAAVIAALLLRLVLGIPVRFSAAIALSCTTLHILMDALTDGRGVMLLWPLTERRFLSPVLLFTGLHWSEGMWSPRHRLTALNEIIVISGIAGIGWALKAHRRARCTD